ncbi:riboflavin biosynthesis protein RibD, partial [Stenotrophomonas maltophilia]
LGDNGRPLLAGLGIDAMEQQRRLHVVDQCQVGEDIRLLLRP